MIRYSSRTGLPQTIHYPCFAEVIRRHLEFHAIAQVESDKALAHLTGDMRKHHLVVGQLDTKHRSRKDRDNFTLDWNGWFVGHDKLNLG